MNLHQSNIICNVQHLTRGAIYMNKGELVCMSVHLFFAIYFFEFSYESA